MNNCLKQKYQGKPFFRLQCQKTETVTSNYDLPSRTNSNCECRRPKKSSFRNDLIPAERSASVPPRPLTKRITKIVPPNYLKTKPKIVDNKHKNLSPKSVTASSPKSTGSPKRGPVIKTDTDVIVTQILKPGCNTKKPVPTPRTLLASSKTKIALKTNTVPDYEYLQFSLRITEDIIRNDLYTQKEMRRVFNSHIEANRGRLSLTKMLQHIDHLCKELNISKKASLQEIPETQQKCCQTDSKLSLMQKINSGQYLINENEIQQLSEEELQLIISGILCEDCPDCSEHIIIKPNDATKEPSLLSSDANQSKSEDNIILYEKTSENSGEKSNDIIEETDCSCPVEIKDSDCSCHVEIEDTVLPKQDNGEVLIETPLETLQTSDDTQEVQNKCEDSTQCIQNICAVINETDATECVIDDVGEDTQSVKSATILEETIEKPLELSQRISQLVEAEVALKTVLANELKALCCSIGSQTCLADCDKILETHESNQSTSVAEIIEIESETSKEVIKTPSSSSLSEEEKASNDVEVKDDQQATSEQMSETSKPVDKEVSIPETSTVVTDSTIQYNIIDMEKFNLTSLKLGVDKFTQTSYSVEKVQFIKTPIPSNENLIGKSKTVDIDSMPPLSIAPPKTCNNCKSSETQSTNRNVATGISEYQSAFECATNVESSNFLGPSCSISNKGVIKTESQSVFKSSKTPKVEKRNTPCPTFNKDSDFIIAIKKLTADNVNALSEILHRHPYAHNCRSGIDKYKMNKPEPTLNRKRAEPTVLSSNTEPTVTSGLVDSKLQNTILSEGEICICPSQTNKFTSPQQSNTKQNCVLEQLKKYEKQHLPNNIQNERRDIKLSDYELNSSGPKNLNSCFYPAHSTQTSFNNKSQMLDKYSLHKQNATKPNRDYGENSLLSDGEMKNTEDSDNETTRSTTSPNT